MWKLLITIEIFYFVIRKRVEVVVNDSDLQKILEDVKKSGKIHNKVFTYDVHESSVLP